MIYKRICNLCGKPFETTSNRRLYCYDKHYRTCVICGYTFEISPNSKRETCSESCRRKLISEIEHNKEKLVWKKCKACGKDFLCSPTSIPVCDNDHYLTCNYCGKRFLASKSQILHNVKTCSKECRYALSRKTYMDHSNDNPNWKKIVLDKYKRTSMDRYGVESPMQTDTIKNKVKETNIKKYGVSSYTKTDEFLEKVKSTNLSKYGFEWYTQTDQFKSSYKQTCMNQYGVDNISKSDIFLSTVMTNPNKLDNLKEFRQDPKCYILTKFSVKPTLHELSDDLGILESSVGYILSKSGNQDLVSVSYSHMEEDVYNFLLTFIPDSEIVRNSFKVITPFQLDLYLPKYKFAIECNPTWTHNSDIAPFSNNRIKSTMYHQRKTELCEKSGIFLFHIFGYEWSHKTDIIKSMIKNILGFNSKKVYARKTVIKNISYSICKDFLDKNHRQGNAASSIRLGLYNDSELVSVMTFSKPRSTIGKFSDTNANNFELVRFCSKQNTSVVGGASKLYKYFVSTYTPDCVISFSDRAHTKGGLYKTLGFECITYSDPGYTWVDLKTDVSYSRINAQKRNIRKFLQDDSIDLNKSENQIMVEHGYVRVFDSGTITWVWKKG